MKCISYQFHPVPRPVADVFHEMGYLRQDFGVAAWNKQISPYYLVCLFLLKLFMIVPAEYSGHVHGIVACHTGCLA